MSAVDTAVVETPQQDQNGNGQHPVEAAAQQSRHDIFKYAEWVHVGDGVEDCELVKALADPERDRTKPLPMCEDEGHFHAWCRLPNPFQIRDIAEKARAARARRIRMLKDPASDAHVILEQELDVLHDENLRATLVDEIVDKGFPQDYQAAMREVKDREPEDWEAPEDDPDAKAPKIFANIEQDQEEFARQAKLPEDRRGDDFEELEKTVQRWGDAINEELDKIQEPKRDALTQKPLEELIDLARRDRIDDQATEAYLHTFNTWQWFVCTYAPRPKGTPNERVWKDITQFKMDTPPDVVAALQQTFSELESRLATDRQGNL